MCSTGPCPTFASSGPLQFTSCRLNACSNQSCVVSGYADSTCSQVVASTKMNATINDVFSPVQCGPVLPLTSNLSTVLRTWICDFGFTYNAISGSCQGTPCASPPGSYCTPNDTTMTPCPTGTFSLGYQSLCTVCAVGTVNLQTNQTACTPCAAGSFCSANTTSLCPAGAFSAAGQTACTRCAAGTFNSAAGQSDPAVCAPCPGVLGSVAGASVCTAVCPLGAYQSSGTAKCFVCAAGTFCPARALQPLPCPIGTKHIKSNYFSCFVACARMCSAFVFDDFVQFFRHGHMAGFFCPTANSSFPQVCPPSQYCPTTLMTAPLPCTRSNAVNTSGVSACVYPRVTVTSLPAASYYTVTTVAGSDNSGYSDGFGLQARFNGLGLFSTDSSGNVIACDSNNHVIRRVTPSGGAYAIAVD